MSTHLDGNVLGGELGELFTADVTAATGQCASCGAVSANSAASPRSSASFAAHSGHSAACARKAAHSSSGIAPAASRRRSSSGMCFPFVNVTPASTFLSRRESASSPFPGVVPFSPRSPCATSLRNTQAPALVSAPRASSPSPRVLCPVERSAPPPTRDPPAKSRRSRPALPFCLSFAAAAKSPGCAPPPAAIPPVNHVPRQTARLFARLGRTNPAISPLQLLSRARSAWPPKTPIRCIGRRERRGPTRPCERLAPATTNRLPVPLCCLAGSPHLSFATHVSLQLIPPTALTATV